MNSKNISRLDKRRLFVHVKINRAGCKKIKQGRAARPSLCISGSEDLFVYIDLHLFQTARVFEGKLVVLHGLMNDRGKAPGCYILIIETDRFCAIIEAITVI